jgi:pimeloyl-ACP methyl ester carboxylesterase
MREVRALASGAYDSWHLTAPALLMTGAHDPVIRPARLDGWQGHADHVQVAVIEDCGHFAPEERPQAVLGRLEPFLAA